MAKIQEFFSFFHGNVRVLVVCRALWSLFSSIPSPYLTLYILALGASPVEVGLVNSVGVIAGMMIEPLGGYLADRKGRVKLIGVATNLYALSYIFFIVAQDWRALAVGQFFQQLFYFYSPALNAILADSLPPGTRGRGFALERTFPAALSITAPYIGGLAITYLGGEKTGLIPAMRLCYTAALIAGLVVAAIRLKFLKETLSGDNPSLSTKDIPRVLKESYGSVVDTIKWMPSSFRPIVLLQIVQSLFIAIAAPFWVLYASESIGLTALSWGTLMLFSGVFSLLLTIPAGYFVDKYGSRRIILFSIALAPICVLLFLNMSSFWGAAFALILLSVSNTMVIPSFASIIADMIQRDRRGRIYALIGEQGIQVSTSRAPSGGFLLVVPASLGSFLGGYLYTVDRTIPFIALIAALFICLFITYRFIREPEEAEK